MAWVGSGRRFERYHSHRHPVALARRLQVVREASFIWEPIRTCPRRQKGHSTEWGSSEVQTAVERTNYLTKWSKRRRLSSVSGLLRTANFLLEVSWSLDGKPGLNVTFGAWGMPGSVPKRKWLCEQSVPSAPGRREERCLWYLLLRRAVVWAVSLYTGESSTSCATRGYGSVSGSVAWLIWTDQMWPYSSLDILYFPHIVTIFWNPRLTIIR